MKHPSPSRPSLRVATPCYTRFSKRHKQFVLESKPQALEHLARIDQKALRQYQNHLERISPLDRAEYYARQMELRKIRSPWMLEKLLNEPFGRVWRALKLLGLSQPIREFLKAQRSPEYVRFFTERRLLGLLKLGDSRSAWREFRIMAGQADREAGIWKTRK